jgi:hypothetical protein
MKQGWKEIVGKTIEAIVVGKSAKAPYRQVFLRFTDGTSLEIYGDSFTCANGVDRRADPEAAIDLRHGEVVAIYLKGDKMPKRSMGPHILDGEDEREYYVRAQAETLEITSGPELAAWETARLAIEKARRKRATGA